MERVRLTVDLESGQTAKEYGLTPKNKGMTRGTFGVRANYHEKWVYSDSKLIKIM